jgi:hypothetical protein
MKLYEYCFWNGFLSRIFLSFRSVAFLQLSESRRCVITQITNKEIPRIQTHATLLRFSVSLNTNSGSLVCIRGCRFWFHLPFYAVNVFHEMFGIPSKLAILKKPVEYKVDPSEFLLHFFLGSLWNGIL